MGKSSGMLMMILMLLCIVYANACYTSIISFGASIVDTGNLNVLEPGYYYLNPPYGETFFHKATGRCSDGRLINDFLAESFGLRLTPAYLCVKEKLKKNGLGDGVNYAAVGAPVLDRWYDDVKPGDDPISNASLSVQMGWFKDTLAAVCNNVSDCKNLVGSSLILMGEFGANDYSRALLVDDGESYVPIVVEAIISAINELIELGAKTFVVPGILPMGCVPELLTTFYAPTNINNSIGCVSEVNKLLEYHNDFLQKELNKVRVLHPQINVIYADYYNAAMQLYLSPSKYGFTSGALEACCGGGGQLNCNPLVPCGHPSSTSCAKPDTYVHWDGVHLTEAANRFVAKSVFEGPYSTPQFNSLCSSSRSRLVGGLSYSM